MNRDSLHVQIARVVNTPTLDAFDIADHILALVEPILRERDEAREGRRLYHDSMFEWKVKAERAEAALTSTRKLLTEAAVALYPFTQQARAEYGGERLLVPGGSCRRAASIIAKIRDHGNG
jgi:hypothetical protein